MSRVHLSRVENANSQKLLRDTGVQNGHGGVVNARSHKQGMTNFAAVFLSITAILVSCFALFVVLKYAGSTIGASEATAEPIRKAEVSQYFKARNDNGNHESADVIRPDDISVPVPNHLLQRYMMSNLLTGGDRQRKIDGLLRIVENDVTANKSAMTSAREFAEIIQASSMTKDDVVDLANQYQDGGSHLRSAILFYSAHKIDPIQCDNDTSGVVQCLQRMLVASHGLVQAGDINIVRELVLPLMNDMVNDARRVTCASREDGVKQVAWGLRTIAMTYDVIGDYVTFARKSKKAVQFVRKELGDKASTYHIFALCLDSAAVARYKLGKYTTALKYYRRALSAFKDATDWESVDDKFLFINSTQDNIKNTEQRVRVTARHRHTED